MQTVVSWIAAALGLLIRPCYAITGHYSLAILLFVLLSKIILLPLSIMVQNNSIKSVRMQPEINWIHVHHWGDKEAIAEEQSKVNKKYRYNVWISLVPIIIQFVLLLGLVEVIYNPLRYILRLPEDVIAQIVQIASNATGVPVTDSAIELSAVQLIKEDASLFASVPAAVLERVAGIEMGLFGMSLAWVPSVKRGVTWVFPFFAALSSWLLCFTQNKAQVLQAEQNKWNKYGVMAFSVLLSLYLGLFVPAGIAYYWVISNLMAIALMYILNWCINPKKYVDYPELRRRQKALDELKALANSGGKKKRDPEEVRRENEDYRRFFRVANKHLVFYSERSGFYKYYADMIASLLARTNLYIHYVTNDPNDQIFEIAKTAPRILPYYIGPKKIVTTMMRMDADVVVMTTPDLDTYQIKRSFIRRDVEYIYTPHDAMSVHMGFREGAMDHFDTILCVGPQQMREIRETERVYGLPEKRLIPCGYCQLDDLRRNFRPQPEKAKKAILIAPSWQEDNLLDSCIDTLLEQLCGQGWAIIVRPHPEYVKRYRERLDRLIGKYEEKIGEDLRFETDFSSNESIWTSDLLITDWSGIAYEFSYTTERPTLFVNTKIKMENPNWEKIGITPLEIALRDLVGVSLNKEDLGKTRETVAGMLAAPEKWKAQIARVRDENVFNPGRCGETAADYIIQTFTEKREKKQKQAAKSAQTEGGDGNETENETANA